MPNHTCTLEGCEKPLRCRGYCGMHYRRARLNGGDPGPVGRVRPPMVGPCHVDGCDRTRMYRDYCSMHYRRARANGGNIAPPKGSPEHPSIEEAFWNRVSIGEMHDCWEWQGGTHEDGYGFLTFRGSMRRAHRVACEIGMGRPMAPGTLACHECNNPKCVNPFHVYEGDHQSNADDRVRSGRSPRGELNAKNVLSVEQVLEIRSLQGIESDTRVAAKFGVARSSVYNIWHRRNWAWL